MGDFKLPSVTVDAIIEDESKVLLIRRKGKTFHGFLALPGGYVDYGEAVENAVVREVKEEVGLEALPKAILGVYSAPERDPRGHVISIVFIVEALGDPIAGDDASDFEWVKLEELEQMDLAFDHGLVLKDYVKWKEENQTFWSLKKRV
ncbi:MAG: NUDIX hydrolase [Methanobacteriota archaeon]|nr:MAG: NUDIX hydrolase [Euryarchaeota archaeon]